MFTEGHMDGQTDSEMPGSSLYPPKPFGLGYKNLRVGSKKRTVGQ